MWQNRLLYSSAMSEPEIVIRECTSIEDFQQCIALERTVWNDADIGIMPIRLYMISKACNAPTIGAFQSEKLVGFVYTMIALMAGVPLIIWTFKPLQSRNAHFNLNKLGAIIRKYAVNYYGEGLSTVFDSNVPSDRVFAEWWVSSPYVASALAGERRAPQDKSQWVSIPDNIEGVRAQSIEEHKRWRVQVREEFQDKLAQGLIARGFEREAGMGRYLFGSDEPQFTHQS